MKIGTNDISAVKIGSIDVNKVYLGANLVWQKVAATLLLDLYPNAEIALDFFKLRTAYNGNCIRVRRSSDNAELDIGFVDNYIDTASLLTFAGAEDAFIVKRYDQSGNSNDTFVNTAANQPRIVNAGVLVTEGGIAMGDWDGTNDYLATAVGLNFGTSARSIFTVQKADTIAVSTIVNLASNSTAGGAWLVSPEVAVRAVAQGWISLTPISTDSISLISNIYIGGNIHSGNNMWIDGSSVTRTSGNDGAINTQNTVLSEGAQSTASNAFDGRKGTLIVYKSDQTANRTAIENIINSNYNIYWDGSQTGLLDDYPSAAAAYSLRALNSAYTGALITVRRSSDNATQDIYAKYDGSLDADSLLTFVGSGDGFVSTWYDQSGAGNDAVQASASSQPQIVSSGSVINENGKISVKFDGTTDYIQNELSVGPTVTAFAVSRIVSESDYNFIYDSFGTKGRLRLGLWVTQEYFADNADGSNIVAFSTTASNGSQNLFFAKHTNSNVSVSVNQDTLQTVASTNFSQNSQYFVIGSRNNGTDHFLDGTIQELIIYPSDQSANRAGIETNINDYYTIY